MNPTYNFLNNPIHRSSLQNIMALKTSYNKLKTNSEQIQHIDMTKKREDKSSSLEFLQNSENLCTNHNETCLKNTIFQLKCVQFEEYSTKQKIIFLIKSNRLMKYSEILDKNPQFKQYLKQIYPKLSLEQAIRKMPKSEYSLKSCPCQPKHMHLYFRNKMVPSVSQREEFVQKIYNEGFIDNKKLNTKICQLGYGWETKVEDVTKFFALRQEKTKQWIASITQNQSCEGIERYSQLEQILMDQLSNKQNLLQVKNEYFQKQLLKQRKTLPNVIISDIKHKFLNRKLRHKCFECECGMKHPILQYSGYKVPSNKIKESLLEYFHIHNDKRSDIIIRNQFQRYGYSWVELKQDVQNYSKRCKQCQNNTHGHQVKQLQGSFSAPWQNLSQFSNNKFLEQNRKDNKDNKLTIMRDQMNKSARNTQKKMQIQLRRDKFIQENAKN